jgi:hypothetical protein
MPGGSPQEAAATALQKFIENRVQPELAGVARAAVALVAREAPELEPGMRGGTEKYIPVPVWRRGRDVIVLSPSKKAITLAFAQGALLVDPEGLLGGAGKVSRTLTLRRVEDVERPAVAALVRAARDLATKT